MCNTNGVVVGSIGHNCWLFWWFVVTFASPAPPAAPSAPAAPPSDAAPQILTVAVSDTLKVRLQNHLLSTQAAGVLVQNGPFPPVAVAVPVQSARDTGGGVSVAGGSGSARRVPAPLVHLAPTALAHKHLQLHHQPAPLVVAAPSHAIHHVAPNKLKVLHAHSLTHSQRTQLLGQNRVAHLPTVVSLATLADPKSTGTALLKAAPGSVAQLFEIKSGQLGKGPHLVNVVRQPRLDSQLKGNVTPAPPRPHRVSVSLDGRQLVRAALPTVRPPHVRHQIQLKNRTVQVPRVAAVEQPSTSITITAPGKTASIPSSVVANLLQKNVQLPKGGQKIAISAPGGHALSANVQAIAFTTAAQLKARQARLIAQPRPAPVSEIVETSGTVTGAAAASGAGGIGADGVLESPGETEDATTNGAVRRRTGDSLPMEVT